MELKHVVVDGSNIATEGRSLPSLAQLDEAVRAFLSENPTENLTVIVDATFGHRIDTKERAAYEEAILAGELITPPAGAIGRGDAFVLQIAERVDATILSNDSFQEFHGQYTWLFDEGRLVGGKPVPGVGWVFLLRTPVRGPASRRAVRESGAPRGARGSASGSSESRSREPRGGRGRNRRNRGSSTSSAPLSAREEAAEIAERDRKLANMDPINDPLPFIEFVANHPVGSMVDGVVEKFASHGAYIRAADALCYVPLKFMGDPAPRSARDAMTVGETRRFAVHAFDTPRRGIDLALMLTRADSERAARAVASVADEMTITDPTLTNASTRPRRSRSARGANAQDRAAAADGSSVDAHNRDDFAAGSESDRGARRNTRVRAASAKANTSPSITATNLGGEIIAEEAPVTPAKKKASARKAPAKKKAAARKAPAKKKAAAKKAPARKKAAAKKAPAKKRAAAKKAPARKKAAAKKAPARKKKAAAKKAPAKKKAAAKKAPARKKAAAKKAPARKKKAAARKR